MIGFINSGMNGQPEGYDLFKVREVPYMLFLSKAIYEFDLIPPKLTFVDGDVMWQPGDTFEFDWGTVPRVSQIWIPKDRYLGFIFHDFLCRFGYLWRSTDGGKTWNKYHMDRTRADRLLRRMCQFDPEPGSFVSRWTVWAGVRIGALFMPQLPKIPPEPPATLKPQSLQQMLQ